MHFRGFCCKVGGGVPQIIFIFIFFDEGLDKKETLLLYYILV